VRESGGNLVQYLDSDDLLHPEKLAVQAAVLAERPGLDMTYCLDEYFVERPGDTGVLWNAPSGSDDLDRFLVDDPVWHTGSPLWRRSFLEGLGGWADELTCWQDWEFHVRALCRGVRTEHIPRVLHYIRDHELARSTNLGSSSERAESRLEAARLVEDALRGASRLTARRGDALAWFLLGVAVDLARSGARDRARTAMAWAGECSAGKRPRLVGAAMRMALLVEPRRARRTSVGGVQRIADRAGLWPSGRTTWKTIRARSDSPNETLAGALEAVNADQVATVG
jgi:hypothetical protein